MLGDPEVDWEFDQPQPIKMTEELRQQLEGGERLNISFVDHDSAEFEPLLKTKENREDEVPRKIHMVWIGSVLPEKYWSGPYSFSLLNPGFRVHLWLDHLPPHNMPNPANLQVEDITLEEWASEDLLEASTNWAMRTDILRMEIVQRYGGIYVDVDAVAKRPFGPVFSRSFLTLRTAGWIKNSPLFRVLDKNDPPRAGLENSPLGFPAGSPFLSFWMAALRENFPHHSATLFRTGPVLLKETVLQFPEQDVFSFISWDYLGRNSDIAILVDDPGNSDWNDKQDVRLVASKVID